MECIDFLIIYVYFVMSHHSSTYESLKMLRLSTLRLVSSRTLD